MAEHVATARRTGAACLRDWGLDDLTDTVKLLISELVTNAVLHGWGDEVLLSLVIQDGEVRLQVKDGSPCRPRMSVAEVGSEGGRGLFLVDQFSDRWGTSEDGTCTWCALAIGDHEPRSVPR
ncbi:ATP-binding protein [Streptomyces sp. NPDC088725]|uniref:ATP-binding protein n=1 Tax=Streptomyces sp. NPDC088725 TaxID=3365873 RepID=UPI00382CB8A7